MEKLKNPKQYVGKKVRMIDKDLHKNSPGWYPKAGTIGTIVDYGITDNIVCVDWGENSGVDKNLIENNYAWAVGWKSIELVNDTQSNQPNMTNEEIWEMLKPKMEKNGLTSIASISRFSASDYPNGLARCEFIPAYAEKDVQKAIVLAYRSGYGRGQKGRPFVIGEKKQQGPHWEWIKPNEIVPDGTKVRYMKRAKDDDGNDPYYPNIGQECIKLNAPGSFDSRFWVQFEGSKYEYTYLDSCRDCFQKWVEDDE